MVQKCCTWLCREYNKEVHWGFQCYSYSMAKIGMSVSFPWPMLTPSSFFRLLWLGHSRAQLSSSVFILLYFYDKSRKNMLHWKSYQNNASVGNIDSDNIESSKVILIRKELRNLLSCNCFRMLPLYRLLLLSSCESKAVSTHYIVCFLYEAWETLGNLFERETRPYRRGMKNEERRKMY